ncbi:MAG: class I-like SAM-binding methyltransferase superfamily [Paramarteilia canceri]
MLNDFERNEKYKNALQKIAESSKESLVLEIGSGLGLLSMYCLQLGFKNITACEVDPFLCRAFIKNINDCLKLLPNQIQPILFNALSTDLDKLLPNDRKYDVIFTELFDSSFFSERFLSVIVHAIEKLLNEGGLIIPQNVTLKITPVEFPWLRKRCMAQYCINKDSITSKMFVASEYLQEWKNYSQYFDAWYDDQHIKKLCTPIEISLSFTVENLPYLKNLLNGEIINLKFDQFSIPGQLDAYMLEFDLNLIENIELQVSESRKLSCWPQAFFPDFRCHKVIRGSVEEVNISLEKDHIQINPCTNPAHVFSSLPPIVVAKTSNFQANIFKKQLLTFLNASNSETNVFIHTLNLQIISHFCCLAMKGLIDNLTISVAGDHIDARFLETLVEMVEIYELDQTEKATFVQNYKQLNEDDEISHVFIDFCTGDGNVSLDSLNVWLHIQSLTNDIQFLPNIIKIGVQFFKSGRLRSMVYPMYDENDESQQVCAKFLEDFTDPRINDIPFCSKTIGRKSKVIYHSLYLEDLNLNETSLFPIGHVNFKGFVDGFLYWIDDEYAELQNSNVCAFVFENSFTASQILNTKFFYSIDKKDLNFTYSS